MSRHVLLFSGGLDSTYLLFKLLIELDFDKDHLVIMVCNSGNFMNNNRQLESIKSILRFLNDKIGTRRVSVSEVDLTCYNKFNYEKFPEEMSEYDNTCKFSWSGHGQIPLLILSALSAINVTEENIIHFGYCKDDFINDHFTYETLSQIDETIESYKPFISYDRDMKVKTVYDLCKVSKREIILDLVNILIEALSYQSATYILKQISYCENQDCCNLFEHDEITLCPSCRKIKPILSSLIHDEDLPLLEKSLVATLIRGEPSFDRVLS